MRSVLATVDYDYWQGRLANLETFQFIQTFQQDVRRNKSRIRKEAIDELCSFVRDFVPFSDERRIRFDHIHSDEF